jgi:hypothetical protein
MKLNNNNVIEWLKELDTLVFERYGILNYSNTIPHKSWIKLHVGKTAETAIIDEFSYGD